MLRMFIHDLFSHAGIGVMVLIGGWYYQFCRKEKRLWNSDTAERDEDTDDQNQEAETIREGSISGH